MSVMFSKILEIYLTYLLISHCTCQKIQCRDREAIPGHNLGGEGFDIISMERKTYNVIDMDAKYTGNTCKEYINPHLGGKTQRTPAAVVDWKPRYECSGSVTYSYQKSANTFQESQSQRVENSWNIGLNLGDIGLDVAGSQSKLSKFAKTSGSSFSEIYVSCTRYEYSLDPSSPPLTKHFIEAIDRLPLYYDGPSGNYMNFIDNYGTHYFNKVTLGGIIHSLTVVEECEAQQYGFSAESMSTCLGLEIKKGFFGPSLEYENCIGQFHGVGSSQNISSYFQKREHNIVGGNSEGMEDLFFKPEGKSKYMAWAESLKSKPDVIKYSVKPIPSILDSLSTETIPDINIKRESLKTAIQNYIKTNAKNCDICNSVCKSYCSNQIPRDPAMACDCGTATKVGQGHFKVTNLRVLEISGENESITKADVIVETHNVSPHFTTDLTKDSDNTFYLAVPWDFGFQTGGHTFHIELIVREGDLNTSHGLCSVKVEKLANPSISCSVESNLNRGVLQFETQYECVEGLSGDMCETKLPADDCNMTPTSSPSTFPLFELSVGLGVSASVIIIIIVSVCICRWCKFCCFAK